MSALIFHVVGISGRKLVFYINWLISREFYLNLPCHVKFSFFCFDTIKLVKILHMTKLLGTYCSSETYKNI